MGLADTNNPDEQQHIWQAFLTRWPVESLGNMTLETYTHAGDQDTFTYWLESRTEKLGSIWGGSAFKFGIFNRKDRKASQDGSGRTYHDDYAWYTKYGDAPEPAFKSVRAIIVQIATAAAIGELEKIDQADLGDAVKWKLAFLYQRQKPPCVVPIFSATHLRTYLGEKNRSEPISTLQQRVMNKRGSQVLLDFAAAVWKQAQAQLGNSPLTNDAALDYLKERFTLMRDPVQYMAGFLTEQGYPLALDLGNKNVGLFLRDGEWTRKGVKVTRRYEAGDTRHSNLEAHAPNLALGHIACKVEVSTLSALVALCDAYEKEDSMPSTPGRPESEKRSHIHQPLNQILYGPPGTGKTHRTIDKALSILDSAFLAAHADDRSALKTQFDALIANGRVRFITFHQSFSYEDFVEGLRADHDEQGQLRYQVEPGVFQKICTDALGKPAQSAELGIGQNPRIWKISIDGTRPSTTRDYCLANSEARIGWGGVGDLARTDIALESIDEALGKLGSNDRNTLATFAKEIQKGDIFVCIKSATEAQAIGVVLEGYQYEEQCPPGVVEDYQHVIKVRWIYKDLSLPLMDINGGKRFTQKTVYELDRFTWEELGELLKKRGILTGEPTSEPVERKPYVLIIDEINRGNVSRIFGELITLIEPSKRAGNIEALEVILPYSKKPFRVPDNVYLIGTMNTADRSLTGLDIALRRRFVFEELPPRPELLSGVVISGLDIGAMLAVMNQRIEALLDRDHCIGHAYFFRLKEEPSLSVLASIFRQQIVPLLQEYFFENWERIGWIMNDHRKTQFAQRFLRGRLDLAKQLRQPAGRQHLFQIQHDIFEPDRPENRLLHSALDRVRQSTTYPPNWRLAHELATYMTEVPTSQNIDRDFCNWSRERLMAHYEPIKPWCELILSRQLPLAVLNEWSGISLLFPMEKLFERYVTACLRRQLLGSARLISQAATQYLCKHNAKPWFQLRPDILVNKGDRNWILDTKWKRLNSSLHNTVDKYGLDQGDFYQLFAYGQHYLSGQGDMLMIFPRTASFSRALPPFEFSNTLRLWVTPFDLSADRLLINDEVQPSVCEFLTPQPESATSDSLRLIRSMV